MDRYPTMWTCAGKQFGPSGVTPPWSIDAPANQPNDSCSYEVAHPVATLTYFTLVHLDDLLLPHSAQEQPQSRFHCAIWATQIIGCTKEE